MSKTETQEFINPQSCYPGAAEIPAGLVRKNTTSLKVLSMRAYDQWTMVEECDSRQLGGGATLSIYNWMCFPYRYANVAWLVRKILFMEDVE